MSFTPHAASLRQLQYAVAVADTRSFRRAAQQCGVSQPSLSAQLAQLEGALGVRLFERDRRRVLLTPAGEELIERARRVLIDADDLVDAARRLGDPLAGTLVHRRHPDDIAVPAAGGGARHPPRAPAPDACAGVEDKTENLARELHAGRLDAALLALEADLGGPLQREVIGRDRVRAGGAARAPAREAARGRRASASCAARTCLLLDDGHCLRDQALAVCAGARTEELAFRATSLPTLAQMVSAGRRRHAAAAHGGGDREPPRPPRRPPHRRRPRLPYAGAGLAADVTVGAGAAPARRDDPRELREDDLIPHPNRLPHCTLHTAASRGEGTEGSRDGVDDFLQQRFGLGRRADLLRDVEADDPRARAPPTAPSASRSSAASSAEPTAS